MAQPVEPGPGAGSGAARIFPALLANVEQVIRGKRDAIHLALVCLLAEGHLLVEDVPGVGKTSMAKAIARSIGGTWRRIQFTPDLLPSDVTGVSIWNRATGTFEFRPGGVFAHVVLADEINRASPKTQSALLEAMEERQVSVDGDHPPAAAAVPRDRDPEPDRARGDVPPPRGPARPVPHAHPDRLPRPRRRARDPGGAGPLGRGRGPRAGHDRARDRGCDLRVRRGARGPEPAGVRGRPRRRVASRTPTSSSGSAPGRARAAAPRRGSSRRPSDATTSPSTT